MSDHKFQEAVTLVKAGEIDQGQKILLRIVRDNPQYEKAWLWLVNTTPKRANQIGCLEKVLQINPNHQTAKRLLTELRQAQAQAQSSSLDTDMGFEYMGRSVANSGVSGAANGSVPHAHDDDDDDDDFIYTGEFISVPAFDDSADGAPQTDQLLQDPLMLQIEVERQAVAEQAAQEAAKKAQTRQTAVSPNGAQTVRQQIQTSQDKLENGTPKRTNGKPISGPIKPADATQEVRIPDKVFEYSVSMVVSKAKGAFGFLFSGSKGQLTQSILKIAPEVGLLQIKGVDALVQNEQHNLYFNDIREVYSPDEQFLTLVLRNGKDIQLKDVAQVDEIIAVLSTHVHTKGSQNTAVAPNPQADQTQTPDQFESRVSPSA